MANASPCSKTYLNFINLWREGGSQVEQEAAGSEARRRRCKQGNVNTYAALPVASLPLPPHLERVGGRAQTTQRSLNVTYCFPPINTTRRGEGRGGILTPVKCFVRQRYDILQGCVLLSFCGLKEDQQEQYHMCLYTSNLKRHCFRLFVYFSL